MHVPTLRIGSLLLLLVAVYAVLLSITLYPYNGRPSALLHLDTSLSQTHTLPPGFVVLDIPAYDGAQYYLLARHVLAPDTWAHLTTRAPLSYAYQRILLPALAGILSFGFVPALPAVFLAINLVALLLAAWAFHHWQRNTLYTLALVLSPAATLGLHFSLAEPLTLLFTTLFLIRFLTSQKIGWMEALLLSLLVLSREVNVLLVGFTFAYMLWKRQWTSCVWLLLPLSVFAAWHGIIGQIFGEVPFLMSTEKRTLPFAAMFELIAGMQGYTLLTTSSIPLALFVVLPALVWVGQDVLQSAWQTRTVSYLPLATLAFLLLMTTMPDHIWGSITSIGRVITPMYPLLLWTSAQRNTRMAQFLAAAILFLGLCAGFGLASIAHPFHLA